MRCRLEETNLPKLLIPFFHYLLGPTLSRTSRHCVADSLGAGSFGWTRAQYLSSNTCKTIGFRATRHSGNTARHSWRPNRMLYLAVCTNLDNTNKGLAAPLWTDRRQFLVAFHSLVLLWIGFNACAASHKILPHWSIWRKTKKICWSIL